MRYLTLSTQALMALIALSVKKTTGEVVLSKNIMQLSLESAKLSKGAYLPNPDITSYNGVKYDIKNFIEEPDQALITEDSGYCFVAFRGTTGTITDWHQNLKIGNKHVCGVSSSDCCEARRGFYDAYFEPSYVSAFEKEVGNCVKRCKNKDECLVLTGHSQGGAVAAVAGVRFAEYNPYVITFGEPPSLEPGCQSVSDKRWYRYVNTIEDNNDVSISYDPIPFAPGLGTIVFGHFIVLGADIKHVAYLGFDSTQELSPILTGVQAHSMSGTSEHPGYIERIQTLIDDATSYPISTQGFAAPNYCTVDEECELNKCVQEVEAGFSQCMGKNCTKNEDCDTDRCDAGICLPKFGSCMICDEDSDCMSGKCLAQRCTNLQGKVDDQCSCEWNSDCESGRCEGTFDFICEAQLPLGATCNEHNDCLSGNCNWWFHCSKGLFFTKGKNIGRKNDLSLWAITLGLALVCFAIYKYVKNNQTKEGYSEIKGGDGNSVIV